MTNTVTSLAFGIHSTSIVCESLVNWTFRLEQLFARKHITARLAVLPSYAHSVMGCLMFHMKYKPADPALLFPPYRGQEI